MADPDKLGQAQKSRARQRLSLPFTIGWRRLRGFLGPVPNFVIIGAGRSGTTSLFQSLASHPDVTPSIVKETDYFVRTWLPMLASYRTLFYHGPGREPTAAAGEASPRYLQSPDAARRLRSILPDIRIIVMLRDPARRAISNYYHHVERWGLDESLETALETEMALLQPVLDRPWPDMLDRLKAAGMQNYRVASSLYAAQLDAWFAAFRAEQFLLLKSEAFFADPSGVLPRVFEFIGVDPAAEVEVKSANRRDYPPPSAAFLSRLHDFFAGPNERLRQLTGFRLD